MVNSCHQELNFRCEMLYKRLMEGRVNIINYDLPQQHITIKYDISATKVLIRLNDLTIFFQSKLTI